MLPERNMGDRFAARPKYALLTAVAVRCPSPTESLFSGTRKVTSEATISTTLLVDGQHVL